MGAPGGRFGFLSANCSNVTERFANSLAPAPSDRGRCTFLGH